VGRRRGSGFSSGGHDEREQTLNAILVEMDGFDTNDQVIVCAATNRVDVLDPALTRPGRFDRQIAVPLPDVKGRWEILKVHSRKVKLGPNVDLMRLGRATPGFSGADLAAIINESALAQRWRARNSSNRMIWKKHAIKSAGAVRARAGSSTRRKRSQPPITRRVMRSCSISRRMPTRSTR